MVVLVVENMAEGERGWITRWLIETKAGVFVGRVNPIIREKIWSMLQENQTDIMSALMVYSNNTEQGFSMKMLGLPRRYIVDFEGLSFVGSRLNA